jgi:hypothetical protein
VLCTVALSGKKVGGADGPIYTRYQRPDFRPARDPISGRRETRLRPPPPGPRQSCRACRGTCPDVLPLWMTRFPAGVRPDSRPARDPSPATVPGTPAKLPGVLGHVPRCVAVIEDLFSGQGRDPFLAGEDPFPATVSGGPARLPGALGLCLRGEGWRPFAELVPRGGRPIAPRIVAGVQAGA